MNLVNKLKFDVSSPNKEVGKAILNSISGVLDRDFNSNFDTLLTNRFDKKEWITIEKIELMLPPIHPSTWERDIPLFLINALDTYFKENIPSSILEKQSMPSENIQIHTHKKRLEDLILHFIQFGFLPENSFTSDFSKLLKEVEITTIFIEKIISILLDQPQLILRFLHNFEEKFVFKLIQKAIINEKHSFIEFRAQITEGVKLKERNQIIDLILFFEQLIAFSSTNKESVLLYFTEIFKDYTRITGGSILKIIMDFLTYTTSHKIELRALKILEKNFITEIEEQSKLREEKITSEEKKREENRENEPLELEPVFIQNSGLILLHAFLPQLFKTLGYLDSENKLLKSKRVPAVLILQYIVSGKNKCFENELALNKLLCGVEIEEVIPTDYKLTSKEKKQSDLVLTSLISHWKVIKNTSIEGLRESFLRRAGKLSIEENEFQLQVENKGFDILLDQFPYGISYIYLSWMKKPITVEWN